MPSELIRYKLSRGEIATVRIFSGADGGFLAALAEWLFDLRVAIYDSEDNNLLYKNCEDESRAQVCLTFNYLHNGPGTGTLTKITETYFLKNVSQLISIQSRNKSPDYSLSIVGGRLDWENCLSGSFDPEFTQLMEHTDVVGIFIGCIACLLEHSYRYGKNSPDVDLKIPVSQKSLRGRSLLDAVFSRFGELSPLHKDALEALHLSAESAVEKLQYSSAQLADICKCTTCTERGGSRNSRCLTNTLWTILKICKITNAVVLHGELRPTRYGLEKLRLLQSEQNRMLEWLGRRGKLGSNSSTGSLQLHWALREMELMAVRDTFDSKEYNTLIGQALTIFGGRPSYDASIWSGKTSAVSQGGMCVYLDTLREASIRDEAQDCVHVTTGWIEYAGKPFTRISDMRHEIRSANMIGNFDIAQDWASKLQDVRLHVVETVRSLQVEYLFTSASSTHCPDVLIGPYEFNLQTTLIKRQAQCGLKPCSIVDPRFGETRDTYEVRCLFCFLRTCVEFLKIEMLYKQPCKSHVARL